MPIAGVQGTRDVEQALNSILHEADNQARIRHIRYLFSEKLNFDPGRPVGLPGSGE